MEPTLTEYRDALAEIVQLASALRNGGEWTERRRRLWEKYNRIIDAYADAHIREEVQA